MKFPQATSGIWKVSPNNEVGIDVIIGNGSNLMKPDLIMTRGINLRAINSIQLEKKPIVLFTNNDNANLAQLIAMPSDENNDYFITTNGLYELSSFSQTPTFIPLTSANAPQGSFNRDGVIYNSVLHVSGNDRVKSFSQAGGGTWTDVITGFSSSYPILLANFINQVGLAVANGNTIGLYNTSYSLQTTLTIPMQYIVTCMEWRENSLYIGTRNISGGGAMCFIWNGEGTEAQFGYGVQGDWIYSICEFDNSIAIIHSEGQIMKYNGGGFDELANLPVYTTPYSWVSSSSIVANLGKVAPRGMRAIGKRLLINLDGSVTVQGSGFPGIYLPQQPSGLWEYTDNTGLVHRAGYCHTKYQTLTVNEIDSNRIALSGNHNCVTGDAMYFGNITGITGLTAGQTYFAIVEAGATNAMEVALTKADAINGNPISISGTPSGATVCVDAVNEVGATLITHPGAIGLFNKNINNVFFGTELFFGGAMPNDAGTTEYAIMSLGLGRSRAAMVTARIMNADITNQFTQLTTWINNMLASFEGLVVKTRKLANLGYPTIVSEGSVAPVSWVTNQEFTAAVGDRDLSSVKVGDEMTILQGAGAGYTAHVSNITLSVGVWTVTLDEPIGLITNGLQSEVQFDNWVKEKIVNSADSNLSKGYANIEIGKNSAWMQLKLEMRGRDFSLDRFEQVNKSIAKQP